MWLNTGIDLLDSLLSNWLLQAIVSAAISWLFNKLGDPSPSYHAVPSVAVSQSQIVIQGATPDEVRRAVENALRRRKRETGSPAQDPTLIFCVLALRGLIYPLIHYGIVVVDLILWFTFLTGFSAAFSLFRGYRTGLFQERQWIIRTIVILQEWYGGTRLAGSGGLRPRAGRYSPGC